VNLFQSLEHATHVPWVIWSALFVAAIVLLTGFVVRARLAGADGGLVPDAGFTLRNCVELIGEMLANLAEQNMGPHWRRYFPFVATIFLYILFANLIGLVPGFQGATRSANVTWGWAIISFVVHQYVGIKEHGFAYVNHFLGPSLYDLKLGGKTYHLRLLAPLMIVIELISHLSRVFTLAVRLLANMTADHIVVGIWIGMVPLVIPAVFMGMGVFVSFLQAYVFAMLSMIYIGLALEEAH
jgi:F-type H+-transporting ATPase subunit a